MDGLLGRLLSTFGCPGVHAVAAAPGPAGVRVWQAMSRGQGPGARRRRALMLPILWWGRVS